mgnify:CR=1 FL=1
MKRENSRDSFYRVKRSNFISYVLFKHTFPRKNLANSNKFLVDMKKFPFAIKFTTVSKIEAASLYNDPLKFLVTMFVHV